MSLRDIQDKSMADYMATFYKRMAEGQTGAISSGARLRYLRKKDAHPYYWAPFCLVGGWNGQTLVLRPF